MKALVIGVDPGMTTGVLAMLVNGQRVVSDSAIAVQIHGAAGVVPFVEALLDRASCDDDKPLLAVEAFVVGPRSSKTSTPEAGRITRGLIGALEELNANYTSRNAQTVKAWATDRRLAEADLLEPTAAMRHARDAARHALFAAVARGYIRDPLSSSSSRAGAE